MQFECSLHSVKLNTAWAERSAALDYLHIHSRACTRPHAQIGLRRALYKPQRSSIPPFLPTTTAATLACIPRRPLRRPRRSSSSPPLLQPWSSCVYPHPFLSNNPSSSLSSQRLRTFPHVDLPFSFLVSLLFASPFLVVVRVPSPPRLLRPEDALAAKHVVISSYSDFPQFASGTIGNPYVGAAATPWTPSVSLVNTLCARRRRLVLPAAADPSPLSQTPHSLTDY